MLLRISGSHNDTVVCLVSLTVFPPLVYVCVEGWQSLTLPSQTLNTLCSLGWLWTLCSSASASCMLDYRCILPLLAYWSCFVCFWDRVALTRAELPILLFQLPESWDCRYAMHHTWLYKMFFEASGFRTLRDCMAWDLTWRTWPRRLPCSCWPVLLHLFLAQWREAVVVQDCGPVWLLHGDITLWRSKIHSVFSRLDLQGSQKRYQRAGQSLS